MWNALNRLSFGGEEFFAKGVSDFVLMEVSEWTEPRCGVHYSQIFTEMAHCGFRFVYVFDQDGSHRLTRWNNAEPPVSRNVLFSRTEIG